MLKRLFAGPGVIEAYKMYTPAHFTILLICAVAITAALILTRKMKHESVLKVVRWCTIVLWVLEISKIIFNFAVGNADSPNSYIPLYFCSITLYGGIFSSWCKGWLKRVGDVFFVVGGVVGGIVYLLAPTTTAGFYPAVHFITIQSYVLHSIMIYLGLLFIVTDYVKLEMKDLIYYAATITIMAVIAYIVNYFLDSNLMFVSKDFPGTPLSPLYHACGRWFPIVITLIQAVPPFLVMYAIIRACKAMRNSQFAMRN